METLRLSHVCKTYKGKKRKDNDVVAVNDFNLTIEDNEFIVFVGPSGCGKSTTLRMIAGLEDVTSGDIYLDGERVNDVESNYRDIAMVFQNYALYPHMTAYQNMAFGLKNRHVPKEEIDRRIKEAAKILSIEDLLDRKPKAMSGGQRQRVALGRAIVRTPKVFLLDEPLSNLDAKLRASMRVEISRLYEKLHTTFIYVTHDQVEAMTMGTRIVVMRKGVVQQIDTPSNLFDYPKNRFVAGFLGTPQMNFYEGTFSSNGKTAHISFHGHELNVSNSKLREINPKYLDGKEYKVILGIRPDDLYLDKKGFLDAKLGIKEILGNETLLYGNLNLEEETSLRDSPTSIVIKSDRNDEVNSNDIVKLSFPLYKLHLFLDQEGEASIMLTPRANLNKLTGYLSIENDKAIFRLNSKVKLILDEIDANNINDVYKNGMHKVNMLLKSNSIKLDENGIEARVKGIGRLGEKLYARLDLDDEETPFEDDSTCLYLNINSDKISKNVHIKFDFSTIELIGEDHLSIFDLSIKTKPLDLYGIK